MRKRSAMSRGEVTTRARRKRASAHLARTRQRKQGVRPPPRGAAAIGTALGVTLASLVGGIVLAQPVTAATARWWSGGSTAPSIIHVEGAERLSAAEVAEATGLISGAPLDSLDLERVTEAVASHPWIFRARVLRLANGALLVSVVERVPAAVVAIDGEWLVVDASGMPFARARKNQNAQLPRLIAPKGVLRDVADPLLAEASDLAHRLGHLGRGTPAEVTLPTDDSPEGFVARLPGLRARIVLGRRDLGDALARLSRLFDTAPPELSSANVVDLRFADQAVLRREPLPEEAAKAAEVRGRAAPSNDRPAG